MIMRIRMCSETGSKCEFEVAVERRKASEDQRRGCVFDHPKIECANEEGC